DGRAAQDLKKATILPDGHVAAWRVERDRSGDRQNDTVVRSQVADVQVITGVRGGDHGILWEIVEGSLDRVAATVGNNGEDAALRWGVRAEIDRQRRAADVDVAVHRQLIGTGAGDLNLEGRGRGEGRAASGEGAGGHAGIDGA